jgi:hypothetical protein
MLVCEKKCATKNCARRYKKTSAKPRKRKKLHPPKGTFFGSIGLLNRREKAALQVFVITEGITSFL